MKLSGVQGGLFFCLVGFSAVAWADSGDKALIQHVDNRTTVGTKSFSNNSGRIAINQAAGGSNLQTNSHAIGERVIILSDQKNPYLPLTEDSNGQNFSYIEALAFENAQGLISVNQVSGQGNIQANLGAIALQSVIGLGLDDNALDNIASPTALSRTPTDPTDNNRAVIALDSFENAQGIVQINQISGDGNSAVNQFSLQLPSGN